ncbi:MAG: hypothetical protein ACKVSF_06110 [Alphaproteobacteria bacterium]
MTTNLCPSIALVRSLARALGPLLIVASLGGCAALGPAAMISTEVYSYSATKKGSFDHLVSAVAGQDCSIRNAGLGKGFCVDEPTASTEPATYCYRTLADVNCFNVRQPLDASRQTN